MQGGSGAGEVGAWRPQAARGKEERAGWRRGGSRGPEEPQTRGWSLGWGPGPGGSSGRPTAPAGRGLGASVGSRGGGFGALLPLHPVHTHTPILCPLPHPPYRPPSPPPHTLFPSPSPSPPLHTQKRKFSLGKKRLPPWFPENSPPSRAGKTQHDPPLPGVTLLPWGGSYLP